MGMTVEERIAKRSIINILRTSGYPTYANIFKEFDLNLTSDPNTIGFMEPGKGRIVINRFLDERQVSVVIRHEILHHYLDHEQRLLRKLAADTGLDFDTLDDLSIQDLKKKLYANDTFNIAADFEISNRGYTEADKANTRNLNLNGNIVSGLVTEDHNPDWVDLSVEEMYEILNNEREQIEDILKKLIKDIQQQLGDSSENSGSGGSGSGEDSEGSDSEGSGSGGSGSGEDSGEDSEGSGSRGSGSGFKRPVLIGDRPSDEELAKEDAEREAQIQKELEELGEQGETEEEREARLKRIGDLLDDQAVAENAEYESEKKVHDDRSKRYQQQRKAEAEAKKYSNLGSIKDFILDLNDFIASEVKRVTQKTWSKSNPSYEGTGILRKGKRKTENKDIPVINVYFDQSGSWNESDLKIGRDAISTLNTYVEKKQIKIRVYYFSNAIYSDAASARADGGTGAGYDLIMHIKETKPDNVIIMTDSDFDSWPEMHKAPAITVKGGVWLLFKDNSISSNLIAHIKGKKRTKIFTFSR